MLNPKKDIRHRLDSSVKSMRKAIDKVRAIQGMGVKTQAIVGGLLTVYSEKLFPNSVEITEYVEACEATNDFLENKCHIQSETIKQLRRQLRGKSK